MCHTYIEKQETTDDGWNGTNKKKIRTLGEKETYKYFGILDKLRKRFSGEPESFSRQNYIAGINTWAAPS